MEQWKELESLNKAAQDERSQHLAALEIHRVEFLAKPLFDEELTTEALKEAQQILNSSD